MYAVYGKSRLKAREYALKDRRMDDVVMNRLSLDEFSVKLGKVTDEYFSLIRSSKISPVYSNQSEASEYIELAAKADAATDMVIMRQDEREFDDETGKYKTHWAEV